MITATELTHINTHAYIPEHLPAYVTAVSNAEPYLFQPFLCFKKDDTLIFVGYPLGEPFEEKKMKKVLDRAIKELKPLHTALIAPSTAIYKDAGCAEGASDVYYRLDMDSIRIPQKVRNMLNRASKALSIETKRECGEDHLRLIAEFLETHDIGKDTQYIFDRIPAYVSASETAVAINARDREGRLIAFDIAEFGSRDYAFYMFNFASRKPSVPGASDLLLNQLIRSTQEKGRKFINLGLGVNKGVAFFKAKWGARPFLDYQFCQFDIRRKSTIEMLLEKL